MELDETPRQPSPAPAGDNPIEDNITKGIPNVCETSSETEPLPPRFESQPYQAEGGVNPAGVLLLLFLVTASGLLLGGIASLVSRFFYLIVLFPLVMGAGTGLAGMVGVHVGKVRNVWLAAFIGFFGGCLALFTMHYCDYLHFRSQLPEILQPEVSFFRYIDASAEQGVNISRLARGSSMNMGYVGTYIYYGFEMLVAAAASLFVTIVNANDPFCRRCNNWKAEHRLGHVENAPREVVEALRRGELYALQPSLSTNSFVRLIVYTCPNCRAEAPIEILAQRITQNEKNEEKTEKLIQRTYPYEALAVLRHLFPSAHLGDDAS